MKVVQSQKSRKNPKSNPFLVQQQWVLERVCTEEEREVSSIHRASKREREAEIAGENKNFFFTKINSLF